VVSYRGYKEQEGSVGEHSSQQSLWEKQREAEQSHSQNFMSTVLRSMTPIVFGSSPRVTDEVADEHDDDGDSLYGAARLETKSSDSFFDNDGVDEHHSEEAVGPQTINRSYSKSSVFGSQQDLYNLSSRSWSHSQDDQEGHSVESAGSSSLVDQAPAQLVAVRVGGLRRSQPLRVPSPSLYSVSSDSTDNSPRLPIFSNQFSVSRERDDHSLSVSTLGSATLVEEARARVATMRSITTDSLSVSEFSYLTPDSLVPVQHNTMARANTSYASYKLKQELEERRRSEEAEQVRRVLEQSRLAIDVRQEEQRFDVVRAHLQVEAVQPQKDRDDLLVEVANDVQAPEEQELSHVTDKIRLREESRLRAEEKARARFAAFRTAVPQVAQQPPAPAVANQKEVHVTSLFEVARSEQHAHYQVITSTSNSQTVTSTSNSQTVTTSSMISGHLLTTNVSSSLCQSHSAEAMHNSSDLTIEPQLSHSSFDGSSSSDGI
jgi:hypothetical protein